MKTIILLALVLGAFNVEAKLLSVRCESKLKTKEVEFDSEITNVNKPQSIKYFSVNKSEIKKMKDLSKMPLLKNGVISLQLQYGDKLYNTIQFSLQKCDDSFESSGSAELLESTGGFIGVLSTSLSCTCSLK